MLLDSFSHVVEMLKPTDVIQLELQNEEYEGYQLINAKWSEPQII